MTLWGDASQPHRPDDAPREPNWPEDEPTTPRPPARRSRTYGPKFAWRARVLWAIGAVFYGLAAILAVWVAWLTFTADAPDTLRNPHASADVVFDAPERKAGGAGPGPFPGTRWIGELVPTATGDHQLQTYSDGGIRVWLDGRLVIDHTPVSARRRHLGAALVGGRRIVDDRHERPRWG